MLVIETNKIPEHLREYFAPQEVGDGVTRNSHPT